MLWWMLLSAVFAILFGLALFAAYRFYRRAVIYDEVFLFLYEDLEVNIKQFGKMSKSNVMMADPEIQTAHRNMMIMGQRLEEILSRMENSTGLRLRPVVPPPRPKYTDQ